MPQTALTPAQLKLNNYAVQAGDLALAFVACDAVNGNSYVPTGSEVLLLWNTDTVAHGVTINSVPERSSGRSDSSLQNYSIPATSIHAIQMKVQDGWASGGLITLLASSALIKAMVVRVN